MTVVSRQEATEGGGELAKNFCAKVVELFHSCKVDTALRKSEFMNYLKCPVFLGVGAPFYLRFQV